MRLFFCAFLGLVLMQTKPATAQQSIELNSGWKCSPISEVKAAGNAISQQSFDVTHWLKATVPGTVLTTLLNDQKIPDPFWGMNNKKIKDIYDTGRDYYTYWFVKDFKLSPEAGKQRYLNFRGVNYSCDIFLNGQKVNHATHHGMFLRQSYNITSLISKNGVNRLAVIVYPPDVVGKANGGQGGDGTIARGVGTQYTAGWDWIQPIHDRNTGIWDKVTIETTGAININNPHVVTRVPGIRKPTGSQQDAFINASAELKNPTSKDIQGTLVFSIGNTVVKSRITVKANSSLTASLPQLTLKNPRLWWPNGYGEQYLYPSKFEFILDNHQVSDQEVVNVGVREIQHTFNEHIRSQQIAVNGQKIFIKGGNWIISDEMLRFSDARYDAEIRLHHDMNLNLIRVWGGALVERPEFYNACDKYGMLVFQDFWFSGDANGRWQDPLKADDQWTRRKYPDDHALFLASAADQVKLVRNHPSLAIWCGGNEIIPPEDILVPLRDSIIGKLDGTRWFVDYSNSDSMSFNSIGGNGDGPYGIQQISTFWETRTFPFNSEVGSVGVGDYESLKRFIPTENLVAPEYSAENGHSKVDSVWEYHKYIGYDGAIEPYGKAGDVRDFADKAQLINYDQYRALAEGFTSHMWDWYTGVIIWKTQNPWTALRGQMYDYYLDPNACLYGLREGSEPVHAMYNPVTGVISVANNSFEARNLMLIAKVIDMKGKVTVLNQTFALAEPTSIKHYESLKKSLTPFMEKEGCFLTLQLFDMNKKMLSENMYWLADSEGTYSGLKKMEKSELSVSVKRSGAHQLEVTLRNPENAPLAFFNRLSVVNQNTGLRLLPTFYSDNYVSVLPGAQKTILIDYPEHQQANLALQISGWNTKLQTITIDK